MAADFGADMVEHKEDKPKQSSQSVTLVAIDLYNQSEIDELIKQRKVCGWNYTMEAIMFWRDQVEKGAKLLWWITIPDTTTNGAITSHNDTRVGHVSLSSEAFPPHPELAQADRSILTVSSFFILPQHRGGGAGRATWLEVESRARQIPECKQIAIDTLSREYYYPPEGDSSWQDLLDKHSIKLKGLCAEDWYARMGYVKFKNEARYEIPGSDDKLICVFMRKYLK